MRSPRALGALAVSAAIFSAEAPARASPEARLVYARGEGTETCPDEPALRHAVAARIGYDPFFPWAPRTVIVLVSSRGDDLVARVQLVDDEAHAQGARDLTSKGHDCSALVDIIALTISIAIDPRVLVSGPAPPSADPPGPQQGPPVAAPPPDAPSSPPPSHEAEEPAVKDSRSGSPTATRFRLGVELRGVIWSEPGPSSGVALSGALVSQRFSVGAEATADLPSSAQDPAGGSAIAWVATASLAPCVHLGPARGCALASIGALQGYASGVSQQQSHTTLYAGVGGRAGLELPLTSRLVALVHVDALGNLARTTLRVASDDVWKAPAGSLALGVGAAAYF